MISRLVILTFIAVLSMPRLAGRMQEEDLPEGSVEVFVSMDQIQVHLLVRDANGNLIRNLSADDFEITENGTPRQVTSVEQREVPISAIVMADTSESLKSYLPNVLKTAMDFFRGLKNERAAFVLFAEKPELVLDWGEEADVSELLRSRTAGGRTALYDAVIWVTKTKFQDVTGKKLIILITDGIDTSSQATLDDMMRTTRRQGITLYSVIHSNSTMGRYRERFREPNFVCPEHVSKAFHNFMGVQSKFVDESMRFGGRAIFSRRFSDLEQIYADIIEEMKNFYVILYQSDDFSDLDDRKISIATRNTAGEIFVEVTH